MVVSITMSLNDDIMTVSFLTKTQSEVLPEGGEIVSSACSEQGLATEVTFWFD